uniref:PDZ domain-containing protein n=1 Tax=Hanusia phi TaxID=3032 RepID=A0A7S0DU22_9CRYP
MVKATMIAIADATGATNHGIGIVLGNEEQNGVRVVAVQPGQGAWATNAFQPGDVITKIGDLLCAGMSITSIEKLLRGVAGTVVKVTLMKKDGMEVSASVTRGSSHYWQGAQERDDLKNKLNAVIADKEHEQSESHLQLQKVKHELESMKLVKDKAEESLRSEVGAHNNTKKALDDARASLSKAEGTIKAQEAIIKSNAKIHEDLKADLMKLREANDLLQQKLITQEKSREQAETREKRAQDALLAEVEKTKSLDKRRQELEKDVVDLRNKFSAQGDLVKPELDALKAKLQEKEKSHENAKKNIEELQKELKDLSAKHSLNTAEYKSLMDKNAALNQEIMSLKESHEKITRELNEVKDLKSKACNERDLVKAKHASNESELKTMKDKFAETSKKLQSQSATLQETSQSLVKAQGDLKGAQTSLQTWQKRGEEAEKKLSKLQADMQAKTLEANALEAENKELRKLKEKHETLSRDVSNIRSDCTKAKQLKEDAEVKCTRAMATHDKLKEDLEKVISERNDLMKKFTSVEQTMTSKIAELLRDHKEKLWELNQLNLSLEADLKRYLELPDECGVGMRIDEIMKSYVPNGPAVRQIRVMALTPGLSADMSGAIRVGDILVEVNGVKCQDQSLTEVRELIMGPRGTRVTFKIERIEGEKISISGSELNIDLSLQSLQSGTSTPSELASKSNSSPSLRALIFTATLKRGSWGPHHCLISPEEQDVIARGGWTHFLGPDGGAPTALYYTAQVELEATNASKSSRAEPAAGVKSLFPFF